MAQVNMTSTITASGLTSDTISSTVQKVATVTTGGISRTTVVPTVIGSAAVFLTAADWTPTATASAYVYIKNADSGWVRLLTTVTGANDEIYLAAGDWTLFPWTAAVNIEAYAQNANALVEYGVFF